MLVVEAVLALAGEDVRGNLGDVAESDWCELVGCSDRQREDAFLLRLRSVEEEILCVESSPDVRMS